MTKSYQDKEWLTQKYWDEELSQRQIAEIADCHTSSIEVWMRRLGIPTRSRSEAIAAGWRQGIWRERSFDGRQHSAAMKAAWARGVYAQRSYNEDWLNRMSNALRAAHARGCYDGVFQSPTSIEIALCAALDAHGIQHESQFRPRGCSYVFDEFVPPSILIEAHGDYWHGNPQFYDEGDLNATQRRHCARDVEKANWAKHNGYTLIVLWEHDIKTVGAWVLISGAC